MRKPVGVVVAAVVLGLIAAMGALGGLGAIVASFFVPNDPAVPAATAVRAVMVVAATGMVLFFLFCGWTVVGLFRMRAWSRYAILAIGALEFFFCALMAALMILVIARPRPIEPAMPTPMSAHAIFTLTAVFYGLLSLIGAWWLVYFNLAPVRRAFAEARQAGAIATPGVRGLMAAPTAVRADEPQTPGWRIVMIVWASLMLASALVYPVFLAMHVPLFLLGMILRGAAANTVMLVLVAGQLYLGIGLLRKWKPAWYLGMAWQVYVLVYFASFLLPGVWGRYMAYQQDLQGRWGLSVTGPNGTGMVDQRPFQTMGLVAGIIVAVVTVTVLTYALIRQREDYLGMRNGSSGLGETSV